MFLKQFVSFTAMNAAIEASDQRVKQLIRDVDRLLQDIERSATERQSATVIINDNFRDAEYAQNSDRLAMIDAIQRDYPLTSTSQDAAAAQRLVQEANVTAQEVLAGLESVHGQAVAQAYQSEVAKFNTTSVEMVGMMAQSAAMTYKVIITIMNICNAPDRYKVPLLTSLHQMPYKPANFCWDGRLASVLTRIPFFVCFGREPRQHATRGCDIVPDDVYTRKCSSESEGTRFSGPGQKALPSMNDFTLLWIFA